MVNTVDVRQIFAGKRYDIFHLQCRADGGVGVEEAAVLKVDISTFADGNGNVANYTSIDRIEYSIGGITTVRLDWDHTADDEIATLAGTGVMDWASVGGNVDPRSAGGTGDILLTTAGMTANGGYDITLYLRFKA